MQRTSPPFRGDINGSFLRPQAIKEARQQFHDGKITQEQLTKIEDEEIAKLVQKEEDFGLPVVTDGEYRRSWWHFDFLQNLTGIEGYVPENALSFNDGMKTRSWNIRNIGKLDFPADHPHLQHFKYLLTCVKKAVPKMTIPSPLQLCNVGIYNKEVYPNEEDYFRDIGLTYRKAIKAFYDIGCRYLQIDDCVWTKICSETGRKGFQDAGYNTDKLLQTFADIYNSALEGKPADMTISMHGCRGNYRSHYFCEGSYDYCAPYLFGQVKLDALFLEYDSDRAGGFEPLKYIKNQFVVLGLITSKTPELEDKQFIINRLNEAAKIVPKEKLCISTQCGFASTEEGNALTEEQMWNKLRLVLDIAKEYWG